MVRSPASLLGPWQNCHIPQRYSPASRWSGSYGTCSTIVKEVGWIRERETDESPRRKEFHHDLWVLVSFLVAVAPEIAP